MTIEELKYKLNALEERVSLLEREEDTAENRELIDTIIYKKKRTAVEELSRKYRFFVFIALLMVPVVQLNHMFGAPYVRHILCVYFLICALMDISLLCRMKKIRLADMSVSEVARAALSARRLHHLYQLILIPMAVAVVAVLAYYFSFEPMIMWGMSLGALVGGICAWRIYKEMMRNYKTLLKTDI